MEKFCTCSCYYTDNIFLEQYKLHVRFTSEEQFKKDYRHIVQSLGCASDAQYNAVLEKIHAEVERRRNLETQSAERKSIIKETYKPLHQHVYSLQESFLAPEFVEIVNYSLEDGASEEGLLELITSEAAPRVYRFPVFTQDFCKDLVEELEHFECSEAPKGRPNTMNNYGILLNELGFDEGLMTPLRELYLKPISSLLYPDCGGKWLDSHKAFAVKYSLNEDLELSYHYDNAEVTLNVSLGKDFTDGNLYFGDMRQAGAAERDGVCGGGAPCSRGRAPPRATHARCSAHHVRVPLEPGAVDASVASQEPSLPHVQPSTKTTA
ncbi:2-oxoglutarate and iron-dependent oxygenase domain-containing protein 2 isoform X2 [Tachysurus vachellii]|uniref:2-oxoglutarate and iron-dependent oxygenase domain-containing protein 2 isoform X2 n=1 Tax=Tachysurus vachellii TaxID=175792 RepID=UPI00296B5036|nr:2-oxoglutarate and iron-dependent oxygenase domain-containing protein 2 isoform X2 [Tachysurus vachellii]